jgi:hypothetical protein
MSHPEKFKLKRRRRYFVDRPVQGAVVRQAIWYWVWTSITFGLVILFCRIGPSWLSGTTHPSGRVWFHLGPYVLASILLFPIVVSSSIRFSNRFAGPMVRVRRTLKELARGESTGRLKFRENDYWLDIADDINEIATKLSQASQANSDHPSHEQDVPVPGTAVNGASIANCTPSQSVV